MDKIFKTFKKDAKTKCLLTKITNPLSFLDGNETIDILSTSSVLNSDTGFTGLCKK